MMEWTLNNLPNLEEFNWTEQSKVTDLLEVSILLDAMLVCFVAAFAAMFLLLAATLIASARGFAQLGLSPAVSPPLAPGFLRKATAAAGAVATVAFSHLGGCLLRCAATSSRTVLLVAATMTAAIEGYVCEPGSEYTRLLVVFELVLPCLAGTGSTCEGDPVSGAGVENELPDHETGFVNDFLEDVASRRQVRRHAHPVGVLHAPFSRQRKTKSSVWRFLGMMFLETWKIRGVSAVIFENDVDVSREFGARRCFRSPC